MPSPGMPPFVVAPSTQREIVSYLGGTEIGEAAMEAAGSMQSLQRPGSVPGTPGSFAGGRIILASYVAQHQ